MHTIVWQCPGWPIWTETFDFGLWYGLYHPPTAQLYNRLYSYISRSRSYIII